MLFNTSLFAAYFFVFFLLFHFVTRNNHSKLWLIFVASLLFYACWDYRYLALLVGTGLLDFYIAKAIALSKEQNRRRQLVVASIVMNLGVLAVFKYSGFMAENANSLLRLLGVRRELPVLAFVLPVGISFYTFQSISYTIDVYRKSFQPRKTIREFLAGLTFFPHLVAGPIVRSSFLLPQFEKMKSPSWLQCKEGLVLVGVGLMKKTMADLVGPTTDGIFAAAGRGPIGLLDAWTGALAFSAQVYGDFSGYSDIATGVALMLGFKLPPNFELPYLSTSPAVFWRRWHISFSTWLRDYLWVPLSVANPTRPLLVLVMTMLLGGLWHGASWTFVLWGGYHGLLLAAEHGLGQRAAARLRAQQAATPGPARKPVAPPAPPMWRQVLGVVGTFYLVTIGWVLFRATTLASALSIFRGMHLPQVPSKYLFAQVAAFLLILFVIGFSHLVDHWVQTRKSTLVQTIAWLPATALCFMFSICFGGTSRAFIYFQF